MQTVHYKYTRRKSCLYVFKETATLPMCTKTTHSQFRTFNRPEIAAHMTPASPDTSKHVPTGVSRLSSLPKYLPTHRGALANVW